MKKLFGLLIAAGFLLAAGVSEYPSAQTADPEWLNSLNFQMERDEQCEVAYYIRIKEDTLASEKTFEARLQCVDGRQFDATRIGEFEDFKVKRCEIETC